MGKTATTEFAHAEPAPTRNPWNPDHTPGGSSSGSAAAVASGRARRLWVPRPAGWFAAGFLLRSGRREADLRPDQQAWRIPFQLELRPRRVFYPVGSGCGLPLSVLRASTDAAFREPVGGSDSFVWAEAPQAAADWFVRAFYEENTDEQVWSHTEKILSRLKKAGAKILEVEMPPGFAAVHDSHRIIMRAEGAAVHQDLFAKHGEKYRPKTREMIQIGSLIPAVDYLRAQRIKRQFRRDMDRIVRGYDCLLTPTTSSPAPRGL